jgi:hypothetical protein
LPNITTSWRLLCGSRKSLLASVNLSWTLDGKEAFVKAVELVGTPTNQFFVDSSVEFCRLTDTSASG